MRFLVISYDTDEQLPYFDLVIAKDEEEARSIGDDLRPYAQAVTAYTTAELRQAADNLDSLTDEAIAERIAAIHKENMGEEETEPEGKS